MRAAGKFLDYLLDWIFDIDADHLITWDQDIVYRDAFQIGDEVGVSKFAGRPGALWRPATIVGIKEKKWPVIYDIKWGTTEKYGTPLRLSAHALD